jgi:2-(1,2-epoxy-1,2-dihydrophenyl)acetyl-CoA isomerase
MALTLAADVRFGTARTQFHIGAVRIGLTAGECGISYHLPRLIGMARAKTFLFSNSSLSAREAADLGLVSRIVPDDEVEAAAIEEAGRLAVGPVDAMGLAKQIMARSFETSMLDMFGYEGLSQALAMASPEFQEGIDAFLEKRPADFPAAARKGRGD